MSKNKTPTYVLTLPLKTQIYQEDIINKRLEISRNIYNSLLGKVLKRYNLMLDSKEYRTLQKELKDINKEYHDTRLNKEKKRIDKNRKKLYKTRNNIYEKFGLTNYFLYSDVKPMYKHFKDNIGSLEVQAIADRVYKAIEKLLEGKKVYFKKYGEVNSIENKWNRTGLKYIKETGEIIWGTLSIKVTIKNQDIYARTAVTGIIKGRDFGK